MPHGDQRGSGWQFYDASYDGIWDGSLLSQGLGQLTDGKLGPDNFKASYYDQDRGTTQINMFMADWPPKNNRTRTQSANAAGIPFFAFISLDSRNVSVTLLLI